MKYIYTFLIVSALAVSANAQVRVFYDSLESVTILPSGVVVNSANTSNNNFYLGKGAFKKRFGQENTVVGVGAMDSSEVFSSTIVGYQAGKSTNGIANTIIGAASFTKHLTGIKIVNIGALTSLSALSTINDNPFLSSRYIVNVGAANILADSAVSNVTMIGSGIGANMKEGFGSVLIGYNTAGNQKKLTGSVMIGHQAGLSNLGDMVHENVFVGDQVAYRASSSIRNVMMGYQAFSATGAEGAGNVGVGYMNLYNLLQGNYNVTLGEKTAFNLKEGEFNIAMGQSALAKLDSGDHNIAIGALSSALPFNDGFIGLRKGDNNIAIGAACMLSAEVSNDNIAIGAGALNQMTSGFWENIAVGYVSGANFSSGIRTIMIGNNAGVTGDNISFSTGIGNGVRLNSIQEICLGNSSITSVRLYKPWSNYSDRRLKKNICYDKSFGLAFINDLKPVYYNYKVHDEKELQIGLIADDVEDIIIKKGISFSGYSVMNDDQKTKALNYDTFVIPLINAVQELDRKFQNQKSASQLAEFTTVLNSLNDLKK